MALGLERCAVELVHSKGYAGANGSAIVKRSRSFRDQIAEVGCAGDTIDDVPADHEVLLSWARPIDKANCDLLVRTGLDRIEHLRIGNCGRITLTLQQKLRLIHAARHVHREGEKEIDLLSSARKRALG